ncbi:MAG TPA: HigA family addiction module antitoxin [Spirochaetota bacterium]|nr:HigA family addiction module antitoxin [Spirochaetota bacterium]
MNIYKKRPTHPGILLHEEVLKPLGITITEAAARLGVSRKTLSGVINGRYPVTTDMALRIAKATDTTPESWLNMQIRLDLWGARENDKIDVKPFTQAAAV